MERKATQLIVETLTGANAIGSGGQYCWTSDTRKPSEDQSSSWETGRIGHIIG